MSDVIRVILTNAEEATADTIGRVTIEALEWADEAKPRDICGCVSDQPDGPLMSFWTRNKASVSIVFERKEPTHD